MDNLGSGNKACARESPAKCSHKSHCSNAKLFCANPCLLKFYVINLMKGNRLLSSSWAVQTLISPATKGQF